MITIFDKFNKKQIELNKSKNLILNKIDKFIKFNIEFNDDFIKKHVIKEFNKSFDFIHSNSQNGDWVLIIKYTHGKYGFKSDELYFTRNEYNDLLDFIKNPEQYKLKKESEKYNL